MTIGSQMPELDLGLSGPPPPYKIGSQNTPYKFGLNKFLYIRYTKESFSLLVV